MLLSDIKAREGSLQRLKNLFADTSRKVHGTFYTNSFFSKRYTCRSHGLLDKLDVTANEVTLTVSTRVEPAGLAEVEATIDMFVEFGGGDVPGFMPESLLTPETGDQQLIPEIVGITQQLYSIDIMAKMKEPVVKYQDFRMAGQSFTLVEVHHQINEDFFQTVTLLFGDASKMYFFSHFVDAPLNTRDTQRMLELIAHDNITGKLMASVGVKAPGEGGETTLYPYTEFLSVYTNMEGDYIIGTGAGYTKIANTSIPTYRMDVSPMGSGAYMLRLDSKGKNSIYMVMR